MDSATAVHGASGASSRDAAAVGSYTEAEETKTYFLRRPAPPPPAASAAASAPLFAAPSTAFW